MLAEEKIRQKVKTTAEILFRSGLSKAAGGDLTGASLELEQAVRYDKDHTDARNLLGLVWFEMGELGEAMKQWGISCHKKPEDNRAAYYMEEIRGEEDLLTDMSEAITLYNEALAQAKKGDTDFACARLKKAVSLSPRYVKAYLLLALLYLEKEAYKDALTQLDMAAEVDPLNPVIMRYRLMIAERQKSRARDLSTSIRDLSRDIYVQMALPEPDMGEVTPSARRRKAVAGIKGTGMQLLLFVVGIILGLGFMALLYMPGRLQKLQEDNRNLKAELTTTKMQLENLEDDTEDMKEILHRIGVEDAIVDEVMRARIRQMLDEFER